MRLFPFLLVLAVLTSCSSGLNPSSGANRPIGTLIPTSATTPVPVAPVATAGAPASTPAQPPATPASTPAQPPATPASTPAQP
ncbi:hypothetical protein, partial [Roseiflexus sp.]|uniref:hypothetical protein n=1 Tax=Roseiflexus sp. TaxID=2562120 RepID=UPI00398A5F99